MLWWIWCKADSGCYGVWRFTKPEIVWNLNFELVVCSFNQIFNLKCLFLNSGVPSINRLKIATGCSIHNLYIFYWRSTSNCWIIPFKSNSIFCSGRKILINEWRVRLFKDLRSFSNLRKIRLSNRTYWSESCIQIIPII